MASLGHYELRMYHIYILEAYDHTIMIRFDLFLQRFDLFLQNVTAWNQLCVLLETLL